MPGVTRSCRESATRLRHKPDSVERHWSELGIRRALGYRLGLRRLQAFRLAEFAIAAVIKPARLVFRMIERSHPARGPLRQRPPEIRGDARALLGQKQRRGD